MKISNSKKNIFILFAVFHLVICSVEQENSRRVGDYLAPPGTGKYHASIQNFKKYHLCGSAIISDRHVLTAAHCVLKQNASALRIAAGTINLDVGGLYYFLDYYTVIPEYNEPLNQNDVAVIKIRGTFDLNAVHIISLSPTELKEGDVVFMVGFGALWAEGPTSRLMHYLYLPVFNQKRCTYIFEFYRPVTDRMFCTYTVFGQGTCHGDSGSPMVMNNQLVGLVSWIFPCAQGYPDVQVRVNRYIPWIMQQLRR